MVARKIKLNRRLVYFVYWINKINKRKKYVAGWRGLSIRRRAVALIWSDGVISWRSRDARQFNWRVTSVWPIYTFSTSKTGPRKYYLWKKYDWLKNRLFFITENFLGILDRLCAEPMRRSHDFLSLTLAVVGSTSGSCYFLLRCRCLWVCSSVCEELSVFYLAYGNKEKIKTGWKF